MHHNSSALVLELCFVNGLLSIMGTHYNAILGNAILDIVLPYTNAKYNVENSRILCCLIFLCSLLVIFYIICIYTMTLYGLHPSHHKWTVLHKLYLLSHGTDAILTLMQHDDLE